MAKLKYVFRQEWEYKVIGVPFGLGERQLNDLGKDGWELVSVLETTDQYVLIFKRPGITRDQPERRP